jgi:ATP-dependent Clp protease, protease subunit
LMARFTGQPYETIVADFQRDRFFTAGEAREYGLVDALLESEGKIAKEPSEPASVSAS